MHRNHWISGKINSIDMDNQSVIIYNCETGSFHTISWNDNHIHIPQQRTYLQHYGFHEPIHPFLIRDQHEQKRNGYSMEMNSNQDTDDEDDEDIDIAENINNSIIQSIKSKAPSYYKRRNESLMIKSRNIKCDECIPYESEVISYFNMNHVPSTAKIRNESNEEITKFSVDMDEILINDFKGIKIISLQLLFYLNIKIPNAIQIIKTWELTEKLYIAPEKEDNIPERWNVLCSCTKKYHHHKQGKHEWIRCPKCRLFANKNCMYPYLKHFDYDKNEGYIYLSMVCRKYYTMEIIHTKSIINH